MLYMDCINKAKDVAVMIDENTGTAFLLPEYRFMLYVNDLTADFVSDFPGVTDDIIAEDLRLYVKMLNAKADRANELKEFAYEFIKNSAQTTMTDKENKAIDLLLNYAERNQELMKAQQDVAEKKKRIEEMENSAEIAPGIDFTKKQLN